MIGLQTPLALLVAVPLLYLWWRLGRGPRSVWPLRIAMLLLCALAVGSPVLYRGDAGRNIVFLVDRSLSTGREALKAGSEMLQLASEERASNDEITTVTFGDGASALIAEGSPASELKASRLDDSTDLYEGLRLAGSLCGSEGGGRICLISDGLATGQDPMELVPEMHRKSARVDYWPVRREHEQDAAITRVELPERVVAGRPFELLFEVQSPATCEATVQVQSERGDRQQQVSLEPGTNRFVFKDRAPGIGLARRVITVTTPDDSRPENNRAVAVTESEGPSQVLVVNQDGAADNLTRALRSAGMNVRITGTNLHVSSAALKGMKAVILENVALSSLNEQAGAALRNYVLQMGGGLLVTGGKNSFAAGGYYRSRVEPLLPVSMERKEEMKRPRLAMGIVMDRSGSMSMRVASGLSKMDLANRGAAEAVSLLLPQDQVAVFAVDSRAHREVPLTTVGDNYSALSDNILSIESRGGGIFVYNGLQAAVEELLDSNAPNRHIVLFADAADSEQPGKYKELVKEWVNAGGTISVIGLGTEKNRDAAFLKDIAKRSGGEVFFTTDPELLPRVFCQDAMRVARKTFIEQQTGASVLPSIVRLGKLGISNFPSFMGYNLCYAKEDAERLVLTTDENNAPVVALWNRGLGKVAAVTCEVDGQYTGELATWSEYKPFFASLADWLQMDRDDPSLFGTVVRRGRSARVMLEMDQQAAQDCTGATAYVIPPDESEPMELPLHWTSPTAMESTLRLKTNGIYHGVIRTRQGKKVELPPVTLPYSPEFEPRDPETGQETLRKLAEATGGKRIMHVEDLFSGTIAAAGREGAQTDLAPWLAGLVVILLLCDIVTRKALWSHLVPASVRQGAAAAIQSMRKLGREVRGWFEPRKRKRRRRAARWEPAEETQEKTPEPKEAEEEPEKEKTRKESPFERAKRRARD